MQDALNEGGWLGSPELTGIEGVNNSTIRRDVVDVFDFIAVAAAVAARDEKLNIFGYDTSHAGVGAAVDGVGVDLHESVHHGVMRAGFRVYEKVLEIGRRVDILFECGRGDAYLVASAGGC